MATVWYKQVNPPQRKALFSAWLGYVFDGFDFMMIFYILHIIKADLGITDIQATLIGTVAFIARPIGGGLSAPESQEWIEDKYKDKSTFLSVFRKPHLSISMIVFLVCFCLFGANWPINGLLPSYLADNGVNTVVISTLMTIAGLGTLTGTIFFGFVGDKIGVKKTFVVGLITSFIFLCPLFFLFL